MPCGATLVPSVELTISSSGLSGSCISTGLCGCECLSIRCTSGRYVRPLPASGSMARRSRTQTQTWLVIQRAAFAAPTDRRLPNRALGPDWVQQGGCCHDVRGGLSATPIDRAQTERSEEHKAELPATSAISYSGRRLTTN